MSAAHKWDLRSAVYELVLGSYDGYCQRYDDAGNARYLRRIQKARHGISKHQDKRDFWALQRSARMPIYRRSNANVRKVCWWQGEIF